MKIFYLAALVLCTFLGGCKTSLSKAEVVGPSGEITLPKATSIFIPTVNIAKASAWPDGVKPVAKDGFSVNLFAKDIDHPRWLYMLPNGDILVAQSDTPTTNTLQGIKGVISNYFMKLAGAGSKSPNKITLLRDTNKTGVADVKTDFIVDLNSPFGMTLIGNDLYIANTDSIVRYHYEPGDLAINTEKYPPEKIIDLPAGEINYHWTKNIISSQDHQKIYITVGSNSNLAEKGLDKEKNRASILALDLKTRKLEVFATGLRNPNGLAWDQNGKLWTVVNERDELGDNLVPDYLTQVSEGDFFGWPYYYFGDNLDPRVKDFEGKKSNVKVPNYALGAHVAALGLAFGNTSNFSDFYKVGAFISEHGSWNRSTKSGYKVVFISFKDGLPNSIPIDILTGFLSSDDTAYGRPVGLQIDSTGNLLVADDVGNRVWIISEMKKQFQND
jgi:glucose/arabinose dehydrogenase